MHPHFPARGRGFGHHYQTLGPRPAYQSYPSYGPRRVLVQNVAPVLANPVGNVTIRDFALNGNTLSATIEIDGQLYQGSLDVSQLAQAVGDRFAAYHQRLHDLAASSTQATDPSVVANDAQQAAQVAQAASAEQQAAITVAGVALLGSLVDQHVAKHEAMCAGWFDSITHAVSSAARGVYHAGESAYHGVTHTWKKLKVPIQVAATAFGGPAAGALAGTVIDAANGDIGAQQAIAQTQAAAQINPEIAKNLTKATAAAAKATAAYHVADTVQQAAAGNPEAGAQVQELVQAAAAGDPSATSAIQLATIASQLGTQLGTPAPSSPPTGLDTPPATAPAMPVEAAVSGLMNDLRREAMEAVQAHPRHGAQGQVVAYVKPHEGNPPQVRSFANVDAADDWFGQWLGLPYAYYYVAYFDKDDPMYPRPLNESFGKSPPWREANVSGWLPWLTGAAGFAAGYFEPAIADLARKGWAKLKGASGTVAHPVAPPAV